MAYDWPQFDDYRHRLIDTTAGAGASTNGASRSQFYSGPVPFPHRTPTTTQPPLRPFSSATPGLPPPSPNRYPGIRLPPILMFTHPTNFDPWSSPQRPPQSPYPHPFALPSHPPPMFGFYPAREMAFTSSAPIFPPFMNENGPLPQPLPRFARPQPSQTPHYPQYYDDYAYMSFHPSSRPSMNPDNIPPARHSGNGHSQNTQAPYDVDDIEYEVLPDNWPCPRMLTYHPVEDSLDISQMEAIRTRSSTPHMEPAADVSSSGAQTEVMVLVSEPRSPAIDIRQGRITPSSTPAPCLEGEDGVDFGDVALQSETNDTQTVDNDDEESAIHSQADGNGGIRIDPQVYPFYGTWPEPRPLPGYSQTPLFTSSPTLIGTASPIHDLKCRDSQEHHSSPCATPEIPDSNLPPNQTIEEHERSAIASLIDSMTQSLNPDSEPSSTQSLREDLISLPSRHDKLDLSPSPPKSQQISTLVGPEEDVYDINLVPISDAESELGSELSDRSTLPLPEPISTQPISEQPVTIRKDPPNLFYQRDPDGTPLTQSRIGRESVRKVSSQEACRLGATRTLSRRQDFSPDDELRRSCGNQVLLPGYNPCSPRFGHNTADSDNDVEDEVIGPRPDICVTLGCGHTFLNGTIQDYISETVREAAYPWNRGAIPCQICGQQYAFEVGGLGPLVGDDGQIREAYVART